MVVPDRDPKNGDYLVLTKNLERQVVAVHFSSTRKVPAPDGLSIENDRVTTLDDLKSYHRMVMANPGQVHEIVDTNWGRSVYEVEERAHPMRPRTIYHLTPVPMSVPNKPVAARVLFYYPREYGLQAHGRIIALPTEHKNFVLPPRSKPSLVVARPEKPARPPRVVKPASVANPLRPAPTSSVATTTSTQGGSFPKPTRRQNIFASELTATTPAASLRVEGGMLITREPLPIRLQWNEPTTRRDRETFRNLMINPVAGTRATIWWGDGAAPVSYAITRDGGSLLLTSDTGNIYLERNGQRINLRVANPRSALGQWLEAREGDSWRGVEVTDEAGATPTNGNGIIPAEILVEVVAIDAEVDELRGMYRSYLPSYLTLLETAVQETNEMIAIAELPQDVDLIEDTLLDFGTNPDQAIYTSRSHAREWSLRQFLSLMAHNGGWDRPLVLRLAHAIEGYDRLIQQIEEWRNPPPDGPGDGSLGEPQSVSKTMEHASQQAVAPNGSTRNSNNGIEEISWDEEGDVEDVGDVIDAGDVEWGDEDNVARPDFEAPKHRGRNPALYGAASTWATSPAALRTLLKAA